MSCHYFVITNSRLQIESVNILSEVMMEKTFDLEHSNEEVSWGWMACMC